MATVIYYDKDGKAYGKFRSWFEDKKAKAENFVEVCKQNKETVVAIASVAVPGVIELVKLGVKHSQKTDEKNHRKLDMWDPVEGHYWRLRREPKTYEYLEIERRVKNGESRGDVLAEMGLLK